MTERPILFSAPMVRAILAGTKTQTRRAVNPAAYVSERELRRGHRSPAMQVGEAWARCPFGVPGDRLWVREAFLHEPADYCWEASVSIPCRPASTVYRADVDGDARGAGWKPSIHMPRALSRITLEVVGVRVERLQDISHEDAVAEGVEPHPTTGEWRDYLEPSGDRLTPAASFRTLWQSINGAGSWDANPWVWCVEFRKLP